MSFDVIHILLLDGKILCVELKNLKSKALIKHLCVYLQIKSSETFGLTYKDSRGLEEWLDESKMLSEHDIAPCEQILQLIVKIRFIPHHVCQDETNIQQLTLLATRILRQNWFLAEPEIHSQLVALYLLSMFGANLSDADIHSSIIRCNMSMYDPVTNDNYFDTILEAYKRYRENLNSPAEFHLKYLQLMMQFPIFNSRIFIVANAKGDKFRFGVNSVSLTIFHLNKYREPIRKIDLRHVDNVFHRDIKIVISLGGQMRNQRNILDNETITYFALSTHQGDCIYADILACWEKYKTSAPACTINQLLKDEIFQRRLNHWLLNCGGGTSRSNHEYRSESVDMHVISEAEHVSDQIYNELEFGEMNMYDTDLYKKSSQVPSVNNKPIPDFDQMLTEEDRLKTILYEKLSELVQNCNSEKEITGVMPPEYSEYFPTGTSRFTRNPNTLTASRHVHKGCAAEVKYKQLGTNGLTRTISRDNISYHSSSNIKGSMSPSITANRMTGSRSFSDLSLINSPAKSSDQNRHYLTRHVANPSISGASSTASNVTPVRQHLNQSPMISRGHRDHSNAATLSNQRNYAARHMKKSLNNKY